jgi:hypothetical protein
MMKVISIGRFLRDKISRGKKNATDSCLTFFNYCAGPCKWSGTSVTVVTVTFEVTYSMCVLYDWNSWYFLSQESLYS